MILLEMMGFLFYPISRQFRDNRDKTLAKKMICGKESPIHMRKLSFDFMKIISIGHEIIIIIGSNPPNNFE